MSTRDNVDLDAEQEVDLGRYWSAIAARWWLPVLGFLVGVIIGYLISLGGKQVWNASATVYTGAAYSAVGGIQLQGPQANPSTVNAIVHAEDSIDRAAGEAGMRAADLRGNVSTKTISSGTGGTGVVRTTANPLVRVTVQASTRRRAQAAANALSKLVVARLAPYADKKIETLTERIAADQEQIDAIRKQASGSRTRRPRLSSVCSSAWCLTTSCRPSSFSSRRSRSRGRNSSPAPRP